MASGKEYQMAIKIAGKVDKSFTSAMAQVSGALGGVNAVLGQSVKIAASAFAGIAAATAGVGIASAKVGSEFETAMDSVAATAQATETEYEMLEAAAMEMGRTTSKTAAESAAALEYMALAGWSAEDSIAGLPGILHLSEATGLDLATASDLVTDSMAALGLTVQDLGTYLDVAASANNNANTSAEQLMEAYLGVGGTMHNLNIPLTESATALGVLANRGIKGSEAGTALNAIMVNLTTGSGQAGKAMEALGVSAFDSEGNFIGLEATLQAVNTALDGCTEEQRNAYLAAIGGKHHVDALNDLMAGLNTTLENGNTEWEYLQQNLEGADGALEQMRKTKLDNLAGDVAIFNSALQDAGIKIYKNLQTPLRGAVQYATSAIYKVSDALQEGGFTAMSAAIGQVLAESLMEIGGYASSFLGIVFTISDGLFNGLMENAPKIASAAAGLVSQLLIGFVGFYAKFWVTGATLLGQFLLGIASKMPEILAAGREAVQYLATGLIQQMPTIIAGAIQIVLYLIDGIGQMLPTLIAMGAVLIYQLANGLANAAPELIQHAISAVGYIVQGLIDALPTLLAAGVVLILGLVEGITQNLGYLMQTGADLLTNLIQGLVTMLPVIVAAAGDIVTNLLTAIITNLPAILQGGVQIIVSLVLGIVQALPTLFSTMLGAFQQLIESLFSIDWKALGAQIVDSIKAGIANAWEGLKDFFRDPIGNVAALFSSGGQEAGEAYAEGFRVSYVDIQDAANGAASMVVPAFEIDTSALEQFGINASQGLANGITAGSSSIDVAALTAGGNTMSCMVSGMDASMGNVTAAAETAGAQLAASMGSGVSSNTGALTAAISGLTASASSATSGISVPTSIPGASGLATSAAALQQTSTQIKTAMTLAQSSVKTAMTNIGTSLKSGMTGAKRTVTAAMASVSSAIKTGMATAKTAVSTATSNIKSAFSKNLSAALSTARSAMTSVQSTVSSAMSTAQAKVDSALTSIKSVFSTATANVKSVSQTAFSAVQTTVNTVMDAVKNKTTTILTNVKTAFSTATSNVKSVTQTAFSAVQSAITTAMDAAKTKVDTIWTGVESAFSTATSNVKSVTQTAFSAVQTAVNTAMTAANNTVSTVTANIKSAIETAFNAAKGTTSTVFSNIQSTISDKIKTVVGERTEVRYTTYYDPVTRRTIAVPYYTIVPIYGMKSIYTMPTAPAAQSNGGGSSSVSTGNTSSLGSWGKDLVFTVNDSKILTFDKLQRTITGRWGSHSRLGKKDQTEFLGPGLQKMTFTIVLSAMYGVKPRAMLEAIEKAVEAGTINPFVVGGKRIGSGQWKITSATEAWDVVWRQGELVKATLDITMEEYE